MLRGVESVLAVLPGIDMAVGVGAILAGILVLMAVAVVYAVTNLIEICQPNEVLVFSGVRNQRQGYEIVQSGRKVRIPLFNKVDRIDVTNMIIELNVREAYSKGGIPLSIKGVANVKIGGEKPYIDNAVERFLGFQRDDIARVARETLEGNLRGVLARLTPEQVNEDRIQFAQELLHEAEHDLKKLGMKLDSLKIQSVSDEKGYLDSLGRKSSAEIIKYSRIAEADNRAEAIERDADNQLKKAVAKLSAQRSIAAADAQRRVIDAQTRAVAMVAEERSKIGAEVAKAKASLDVQHARLEQVKRQLAADVIEPAQARKAELETQAKANVAKIIEEGKANAAALGALVTMWKEAGESARPLFVLQQFDTILSSMLSTVQQIEIDKVTVIDSSINHIDNHGSLPIKAASGAEQIKQTLGLDLPRLLQGLATAQKENE